MLDSPYRSFLKPLIWYLGLAVAAYVAVKLVRHVRYNIWCRTNPELAKIPHLPQHWLLGNLVNVGKRLDPALGRHPDYGFEEIWNELGRPSCFWMDMSPVGFIVMVTFEPGLAEAVTEPRPGFKYSTMKSDTTHSLHRLLGWDSMVLVHGEEWRALRRRFNKGFAPNHLHSLAPLILNRTQVFISRLKALAETGDEFLMRDLTRDLTSDIITVVALERDFGAQTTPDGQGEKSRFGILTTSRNLSEQAFKVGQPNLLESIDPVRPVLSWLNETILNWRLYNIVAEQLAQTSSPTSSSTEKQKPTRSIASLATADLTPNRTLIKNTVSQLKTFLFAGQDTTATLIQWLCLELSKCTSIQPTDPLYTHYTSILSALLAEHDRVFGTSDPFSALTSLADPLTSEATINTLLPVTNAWIKEALRIHPPASTARMVPFESVTSPPFTIPVSPHPTTAGAFASASSPEQQTATINGLRIYNCAYIIQRDEALWGPDAHLFNPARWLDDSDSDSPSSTTPSPNAYVRALPPGAYRPFERGPRNCIGQTLATLEAVVVLSCVARGFAFEKRRGAATGAIGVAASVAARGRGRGDGDDDGYGAGSGVNGEKEVPSVYSVTAVPRDGMRMRVRMRMRDATNTKGEAAS